MINIRQGTHTLLVTNLSNTASSITSDIPHGNDAVKKTLFKEKTYVPTSFKKTIVESGNYSQSVAIVPSGFKDGKCGYGAVSFKDEQMCYASSGKGYRQVDCTDMHYDRSHKALYEGNTAAKKDEFQDGSKSYSTISERTSFIVDSKSSLYERARQGCGTAASRGHRRDHVNEKGGVGENDMLRRGHDRYRPCDRDVNIDNKDIDRDKYRRNSDKDTNKNKDASNNDIRDGNRNSSHRDDWDRWDSDRNRSKNSDEDRRDSDRRDNDSDRRDSDRRDSDRKQDETATNRGRDHGGMSLTPTDYTDFSQSQTNFYHQRMGPVIPNSVRDIPALYNPADHLLQPLQPPYLTAYPKYSYPCTSDMVYSYSQVLGGGYSGFSTSSISSCPAYALNDYYSTGERSLYGRASASAELSVRQRYTIPGYDVLTATAHYGLQEGSAPAWFVYYLAFD